jgi:hypothetical protein
VTNYELRLGSVLHMYPVVAVIFLAVQSEIGVQRVYSSFSTFYIAFFLVFLSGFHREEAVISVGIYGICDGV